MSDTIPPVWARAALEAAILAALGGGPRHGYALASRLEEVGFGRVRGGSLYPVLGRLEESGALRSAWVAAESGPGRKEYELTDVGRARLAELRAGIGRVQSALDALDDATDTTDIASSSDATTTGATP